MSTDFESIKLQVSMNNTTTNTAVRKNFTIRIIEIPERGLVLEVPIRSCARGHNVIVQIETVKPDKVRGIFQATAKVEDLESASESVDKVTLSLVQFDEKQWKFLCDTFSRRQREIEDFFFAAKGS